MLIVGYYDNHVYLSCDCHVISGAVKCVLLLKEAGLQLRPMAFQYLLQAAKNVGVANSEGGVVSSDDNTTENAMHYLLNHVKVIHNIILYVITLYYFS